MYTFYALLILYNVFCCRHRQTLIQSVGLFTVIREKLLSAGEPVSIAMFNTLFEVSDCVVTYNQQLPIIIVGLLSHCTLLCT